MSNPTTLLIGAAGTIGAATAKLLSAQGHLLLIADRNETALKQLAAAIPNSQYRVIDATDAVATAALFDEVAAGLENVILAAGIEGPIGNLETLEDSAFDDVMRINVGSVWLGLKHALRVLKPKKYGSITVLASISGTVGMPTLAPYAASKHAVIGLVKTAAREAAASGVRVNAVCPGPVESEMMKRIDGMLAEKHPERLKGGKDAAAMLPMQRYAAPADIANMIAFLCSDESSYISGASMMVDGAVTCR